MRSDPTLKRWYREINRKFYHKELPDNVCVQWGQSQDEIEYEDYHGCYGIADFANDGKHKYVIILNREKCTDSLTKLSTLLHETIHVATGLRDDHGPAFQKCLETLMERGAFKKNALLRGRTLF